MKRLQYIALFLVVLLFSGLVSPWNQKYAIAEDTSRQKIYFQWIPHTYKQNETGKAIVRKTTVDYSTGLFTNEDTVLDSVDMSTEYHFKSITGMNTKNPLIAYSILRSRTREMILKFDSKNQSVSILSERNTNDGTIDGVYPDAGMYVVEKGQREYLVYSLATNKLIHKAKERPSEHSNSFVTNFLYHNYFDPEPALGGLYVEVGKYLDPKKYTYVPYPGEFPYEIKPDGTKTKLHSYKQNASDDYVYQKKLTNSVIFKQTKAKNNFKHELIINGKSKTIFETNTNRPDHAFAVAQISPNRKYMILWVNFTEKNKKVKEKEEYRIFDARTGELLQTIPINTTGSSSAIDFGVSWIADTDHIYQSGILNHGAYRVINTDLMTPRRYGNVVSDFKPPHYTFSLDDYLTVNDPIPVRFKGKYVYYNGQGSFRLPDLTVYTPVSELMDLLGGVIVNENRTIRLYYESKTYTLNPKKQIIWKNRTYYPIRDIVSGLGLKLTVKGNNQAAEEWKELQIVE